MKSLQEPTSLQPRTPETIQSNGKFYLYQDGVFNRPDGALVTIDIVKPLTNGVILVELSL